MSGQQERIPTGELRNVIARKLILTSLVIVFVMPVSRLHRLNISHYQTTATHPGLLEDSCSACFTLYTPIRNALDLGPNTHGDGK